MDHALVRSEKRGGSLVRVELLEGDGGIVGFDERLLALDEALARLQALDERAAKVIELRFFGGLSTEAAEALSISVATLKRGLRLCPDVACEPVAVVDSLGTAESGTVSHSLRLTAHPEVIHF